MNKRLQMQHFCATSADEFAMQLGQALSPSGSTNSMEMQDPHRFLLIWGPPNTQKEEFRPIAEIIPRSVRWMASSGREGFYGDTFYQPDESKGEQQWRAVIIASKYITTHSASVYLPDKFDDVSHVKNVVNEIESKLDDDVRTRFFNRRLPSTLLGRGFRGVVYRRPAIVMIFLPGTSGRVLDKQQQGWPAANMDYEIVEELGTRVAHNVGVFGGSAAGNWPPKPVTASWVAGPGLGDHDPVFGRAVSMLVVETDLRFGISCRHGFKAIEGETIAVSGPPKAKFVAAPRVTPGFPACHHIVKLAKQPRDIVVLDDPNADMAAMASLLPRTKQQMKFLVHYEAGEVQPNPAFKYKAEKDTYQFARAVPAGASMQVASTTWEGTVKAAREAIEEAKQLGRVNEIAVCIVINCRGRLRLLSRSDEQGRVDEGGPEAEIKQIRELGKFPLVGCYGDGETASTRTRIPLHRNWTAATLIFGNELNPRYIASATRESISQLEIRIAQGAPIDSLGHEIVEATKSLLEVDDCHIRILDPVSSRLQKRFGEGDWFKVASRAPETGSESTWNGITEHQAFNSKNQPVVCDQADALQRITLDRKHFDASAEEVEKMVRQRHWFVSIPIFDGVECLGVLSFASGDPDYFSNNELNVSRPESLGSRLSSELGSDRNDETLPPTGVRLLVAMQIAHIAAVTIRNTLMRTAETTILSETIRAAGVQEVASSLAANAGALLGQGTFLTLMVPSPDGKRLEAACEQARNGKTLGPDVVYVELEAENGGEKLGITGYSFRSCRPVFVDDVSQIKDEVPFRYKNCIGADISANYAVPVVDSNGGAVAVLNAEARRGVLSKDRHEQVMLRLAGFCQTALRRFDNERENRRKLEELAKLQERYAPDEIRKTKVRRRALCAIFLLCIAVGIFGNSEIHSRQQDLLMISQEIAELNKQIISGNSSPSLNASEVQSDSPQSRLKRLTEAQLSLQALTSGGRFFVNEEAAHDVSRDGKRSWLDVLSSPFRYFSSDIITAMTMLSFGALGALAAEFKGVWRGVKPVPRSFFVGLMGGLGAFLLAQGGKYFFLTVPIAAPPFNPWTSALFAFIAGIAALNSNVLVDLVLQTLDNARKNLRPLQRQRPTQHPDTPSGRDF
jgi:hypothetical protein